MLARMLRNTTPTSVQTSEDDCLRLIGIELREVRSIKSLRTGRPSSPPLLPSLLYASLYRGERLFREYFPLSGSKSSMREQGGLDSNWHVSTAFWTSEKHAAHDIITLKLKRATILGFSLPVASARIPVGLLLFSASPEQEHEVGEYVTRAHPCPHDQFDPDPLREKLVYHAPLLDARNKRKVVGNMRIILWLI